MQNHKTFPAVEETLKEAWNRVKGGILPLFVVMVILHLLAKELLAKETIEAEGFINLIGPKKPLIKPTLALAQVKS